jgi:DNA-binding FadR family transcriptional regulator
MSKIFRGEFAPGSRLPAERQLAAQLGVDRTTLRMALKQLQRMNLLVPRHGSGIEVNDYRAKGGLEVLAAMFALDDVPLEASVVLDAIEFWVEGFSLTAAKAIARMTLDEMRGLEVLLDRSIASVGDMDAFLEVQLEVQDELARLSGSLIFQMLSNSTRPVRRRVIRLLPEAGDVRTSLEELKDMLRLAVATRPGEAMIREGMLYGLRRQTAALREKLMVDGLEPARTGAKKPARRAGPRDAARKKIASKTHAKTRAKTAANPATKTRNQTGAKRG